MKPGDPLAKLERDGRTRRRTRRCEWRCLPRDRRLRRRESYTAGKSTAVKAGCLCGTELSVTVVRRRSMSEYDWGGAPSAVDVREARTLG